MGAMPTGKYKRTSLHIDKLKGKIPWNKGVKGVCKPNSGSFLKGVNNCTKSSVLEGLPNSYPLKNYLKEYSRKRIIFFKKQVFDHYGWVCKCCGETEPYFLTLDHVNNDGFVDKIGKKRRSGCQMYVKIVKEGFGDRYQVLCMNCNYGKYINKGVCPHKQKI